MAGIPYYYDYINTAESRDQPANMHVLNTELGRFYQRYLLKKAMSVFKWSVPEWWDLSYMLYILYCWGFVAILDTPDYGVVPQQCGLRGYNLFYRPTNIVVANPALPGITDRKIGEDCIVIKLQPDYMGVLDLCGHYASQMALMSSSISTNLWNTRIASLFFAETEAEQQALKKTWDRISSGEPAVVVRKNLRDDNGNLKYEIFNREVKTSYIVDDLITDLRKVEAEFDTKVGIPNANTDKRERLISDEVNANNVETHILADGWMDSIQTGIREAAEMFSIKITCDWRYRDGNIGKSEPSGTV